jgi:hypothetical protein
VGWLRQHHGNLTVQDGFVLQLEESNPGNWPIRHPHGDPQSEATALIQVKHWGEH